MRYSLFNKGFIPYYVKFFLTTYLVYSVRSGDLTKDIEDLRNDLERRIEQLSVLFEAKDHLTKAKWQIDIGESFGKAQENLSRAEANLKLAADRADEKSEEVIDKLIEGVKAAKEEVGENLPSASDKIEELLDEMSEVIRSVARMKGE